MKLYNSSKLITVLAAVLVLGCGGDDDPAADASSANDSSPGAADAANSIDANGSTDAAPGSSDGGVFTLTSTAFSEGGVIPTQYANPNHTGTNISPPLAWDNAPAGTQSFAIVFTDFTTGFLHSAIWDIPSSRFDLPEDVDKVFEPTDVPGSKQPNSYLGVRGYAGPAPQTEHSYEFRLHAIDVATLGGVGIGTTRAAVVTAIESASLGFTDLKGSFDPDNP